MFSFYPFYFGPILGAGTALLVLAAAQAQSPGTLENLLHEGVQAFSAGDYERAARLFERAETDFGGDAAFEDGGFLRRVLPLKGFSQLHSGAPGHAIATFERYLRRFETDQHPNPFVLYNFALAQRRHGRADDALDSFARYAEHYPGRPEAAFAVLQKAEILFEQDRAPEALELLQSFAESDASASIRTQARLLAVRKALDRDETAFARALLLDTDWNVDAMPELAVLTFAAISLGDRLMEEQDYAGAIRSYRFALPRNRLIALQQERMETLRANIPAAADDGIPAPTNLRGAQLDFFRNLYRRMERQLDSLREAEDYTPGWHLRRGQALLLEGRYREAWLIFERLAMDETAPQEPRKHAHYRWILAANGIEAWEEALAIARNFTRRYEDSELAPQALFLIAQAHAERRRHAEAIEVLTDLVVAFPEHPQAQMWFFERGFSYTLLDRFETARRDFQVARENYPETRLTSDASLWHALTYVFERNYPEALAALDRLAEEFDNHRLTGEIRYRRAAVLYAMGDLSEARTAADAFIEAYPLHRRFSEALVMKGDILMAKNAPDEALAAFHEVAPDAGAMFPYATFRIGEIHHARGDHEAVASHFRHYLEREDVPDKTRLSEALYWIGRAHARMDRHQEALIIFIAALERYGDAPDARGIDSALNALSNLHRHLRQNGADTAQVAEDARVLLAASSFDQWLEIERAQALRRERLTWYARLTRHLSDRARREDRPHHADALLLEIPEHAPPEKLDPAVLGRVGHFLRERGLSAGEEHLVRLAEDFPESPETAYAHYGLARLAYESGDNETALQRIRRFHSETPAHALAPQAMLLEADLHARNGHPEKAIAVCQTLLQRRDARGRPHATALRRLGELHEQTDAPREAIAYYQRLYTMYRAYEDLVAEAYYRSGLLFERIGDLRASYNTFREMIADERLAAFESYEAAREHLARIEETLPALENGEDGDG